MKKYARIMRRRVPRRRFCDGFDVKRAKVAGRLIYGGKTGRGVSLRLQIKTTKIFSHRSSGGINEHISEPDDDDAAAEIGAAVERKKAAAQAKQTRPSQTASSRLGYGALGGERNRSILTPFPIAAFPCAPPAAFSRVSRCPLPRRPRRR